MQMRYLSIFLFVLGLILQSGCTSQAKKTHLVFEKQYVTYGELKEALDDLKPVGHEGSTHLQYKAVKALRHIAKHMSNPAKRELGVQGLVFISAFNDDRNVEKSSFSRLNAMLDDADETLALKVAIINEQKKIVTAESHYKDESDFIYPEIGAREDALEFLIDRFEDFPEYLQYVTVQAFSQILNNPPTCYEVDNGICDEDDSRDQEDWKQELREQVGDWLEDPTLSKMIKTALVRIIEDSAGPEETEQTNPSKSWLEKWVGNDNIPQQTRDIIQAALNKLENLYPDLTDQNSQTAAPTKENYRFDENYQNLDMADNNTFWYANSKQILNQQLFLPEINSEKYKATNVIMQVPSAWLFFDGFSNEESAKELREIVYSDAIDALELGFLLSLVDDQMFVLEQSIVSAAGKSIWTLDRTLSMIARIFPSLLKRQEDAEYLVDLVVRRIAETDDLHTQRLYFYFLAEGLPYFQPIIEPALCSSLKGTDLLTRQMVKVRVASLSAPLELLSLAKHRQMQATAKSMDEPEQASPNMDSEPYITSFCEEEMARFKPQPRRTLRVEEQETKIEAIIIDKSD